MKKILNLFVLDGSGSMNSIKKQIISGYNEQLNSIKEASKRENIISRASLVVFASLGMGEKNKGIKTKFSNIDISEVPELTNESYHCDGGTPMHDGIGKAIKDADKLLGEDIKNVDVIVTILTDGEENSSKQFTGSQIADLIKEYTDEYGWIFNFIGANVDVESLAKELNIPTGNTISFTADATSTAETMDRYTRSVNCYYAAASVGGAEAENRRTSFMVTE